MTDDRIHVAMMNLLWPRHGVDRQLFYDYWSGAHTQISSRLPGIHQYFQHHLDTESGLLFPGLSQLVEASAPFPGFYGDAEITFATDDALESFADALAPLMEDEQNVFQKTISYQATGQNTKTVVDRTPDHSPNGDLGISEKYFLYLRHAGQDIESFRRTIKDAADVLAGNSDVAKVRYRLPEHYDNDAVTLSAPNVSNHEPDSNQVQGSLEIAFADAMARRGYANSADSTRVADLLGSACRNVFPTRALRTYTVYNHGKITVAGLRTPQMAAQIASIGAANQTDKAVSELLLARHTAVFAPA
ncbi:hypothetical protein J2Y41_004269 [Arthrobacter sp. 1088]|uniref:EthD domain-containing protein n=1 Tax=Arthrobacter sp. 1088 TaxID=2817768 RepID=UPI0028634080|nr:EthD domain-containing protein [Arthrobacter sp. 1088]MDR6688674.1 hypothetical protein [Arthrobacter sp. 1088]